MIHHRGWATNWGIRELGDWPGSQGCGRPLERRSCWKLCWTSHCSACASRSWPGSPTSGRRGRGGEEVTEKREEENKETDYWSDTMVFMCIHSFCACDINMFDLMFSVPQILFLDFKRIYWRWNRRDQRKLNFTLLKKSDCLIWACTERMTRAMTSQLSKHHGPTATASNIDS